ncbi:MAG: T9SS type A sorting domain-containing protein [Ignavibacteria bacterium]|nr:T9SS type A sorting domain-containing protein [Ignavibacteria bacterium]
MNNLFLNQCSRLLVILCIHTPSIFAQQHHFPVGGSQSGGYASGGDEKLLLSVASVSVSENWNMLSVPLQVGDYRKTTLFPTAISNAFAYQGTYVIRDTLKNGAGYWMKFSTPQSVAIFGTPLQTETVAVAADWNMIGSLSAAIPTSAVIPLGTSVTSQFFTYSQGYQISSTIDPGKAYWVKMDTAGNLLLSSSGASVKSTEVMMKTLSSFHKLTIRPADGNEQVVYLGKQLEREFSPDEFILPPVPPPGIFDARFASQRIAEVYPAVLTQPKRFSIVLSSAVFPIHLSWEMASTSRENITLSTSADAQGSREIVLQGKGSVTIDNQQVSTIFLKVESGKQVPTEFALRQCYPNPFNPSTEIEFDIPDDATITLKVYNLLGQEVSTLKDLQHYDAGTYNVEFDGANLPNGVYFYRISAQSTRKQFVDAKKMMLLK